MPRTSSVWPLDNPPGVPVDRRSIIGLQTNLHRWRACVRISSDTKDRANVMISWATATCVALHTGLHHLCPWLTAVYYWLTQCMRPLLTWRLWLVQALWWWPAGRAVIGSCNALCTIVDVTVYWVLRDGQFISFIYLAATLHHYI